MPVCSIIVEFQLNITLLLLSSKDVDQTICSVQVPTEVNVFVGSASVGNFK